jgi:DNA-binding CsgD family transcriptional regulator
MPPVEAAGNSRAERLAHGREAYARREWRSAHASLGTADRATPLGPEDLELLATSASMLGRDDEHLQVLERAHHGHLEAGETLRAARCASWAGTHLLIRGEMARGAGWLARAQRLVEQEKSDCVERGYLLVPVMMGQEAAGDSAAAYDTAVSAAGIAERFGDADLLGLARHQQGRLLIKQGRQAAGFSLLDETMLAVTSGELSPIVTGLIYCSVIEGCQQVYELGRAQEWTAALTRWCAGQPDMVSFTGRCLVHRAEILQLRGAWPAALDEARMAERRFGQVMQEVAAGEASYRKGEIHRLRGESAAAARAYRDARQRGWEPQPGLCLLRLAERNTDAAAAAIRRVLGETAGVSQRAALLPAYIEIMLAVGAVDDARAACRELEEITDGFGSRMLAAAVAQARGAIALGEGDGWAALVPLRHACRAWQELDVPFEAARVRVLVGLACRALGDEDTATLELEAAREVFAQLGAAPDVARVDSLAAGVDARGSHGLSPRELEVLRLVASGATNKAIAASLFLSERTVERHLSNIFSKLRVPSRAAATAYAYEHRLI